MEYIPYIVYVISPGTRFERDRKVFFDPAGEVSRGEPLTNYGWSTSGFKELIEAFYVSQKGTTKGFERYYKTRIRGRPSNIVQKLKQDGLLKNELRGFIQLRIKRNVTVPVLYVEIDNICYKFCNGCSTSFNTAGIPPKLKSLLKNNQLLSSFQKTFQCARQICERLCEYYKDCVLSYTSTEGDSEVEEEKEDCLIDMLRQMLGISSGSSKYEHVIKEDAGDILSVIGSPRHCTYCIERHLRFDFTPLRYFFFDPKTWSKMRRKRYNKKGFNPNFNAIPVKLISDFLLEDEYFIGAGIQAPRRRKGVFECFLRVSDINFEIKYDLTPYNCDICNQTHRITSIPIKAMFREDVVFKHEANFAELLWQQLWKKHPEAFCNSFDGKSVIKASESRVLRREMKVEEIFSGSIFGQHSYDYAIDMSELGISIDRLLLFDLTTALWKKSGFHEEARTPQEHLEIWKEMLYKIPQTRPETIATWYILVNTTEDTFFDGTAPAEVMNMNNLLRQIASEDIKSVKVIRTEYEASKIDLALHKLIVVPVFKTLQNRRAFITELKRLEKKRFNLLLISKVVDFLLS